MPNILSNALNVEGNTVIFSGLSTLGKSLFWNYDYNYIMNNLETKEYINLYLPIVKSEVSQANSKLSFVATLSGILISAMVTTIIFLDSYMIDKHYWLAVSLIIVFSIITLVNLISLLIAGKSLQLIKDFKHDKEFRSLDKSLDLYNFFEISSVSQEVFLSEFKTEDINQINALKQICINSNLAKRKYDKANKALTIALFGLNKLNVK